MGIMAKSGTNSKFTKKCIRNTKPIIKRKPQANKNVSCRATKNSEELLFNKKRKRLSRVNEEVKEPSKNPLQIREIIREIFENDDTSSVVKTSKKLSHTSIVGNSKVVKKKGSLSDKTQAEIRALQRNRRCSIRQRAHMNEPFLNEILTPESKNSPVKKKGTVVGTSKLKESDSNDENCKKILLSSKFEDALNSGKIKKKKQNLLKSPPRKIKLTKIREHNKKVTNNEGEVPKNFELRKRKKCGKEKSQILEFNTLQSNSLHVSSPPSSPLSSINVTSCKKPKKKFSRFKRIRISSEDSEDITEPRSYIRPPILSESEESLLSEIQTNKDSETESSFLEGNINQVFKNTSETSNFDFCPESKDTMFSELNKVSFLTKENVPDFKYAQISSYQKNSLPVTEISPKTFDRVLPHKPATFEILSPYKPETSKECNPQKPVTSGKISPHKLVTSEKCSPQKRVTSEKCPQKPVTSEKCPQKPVTSEKCNPQKLVTSVKISPQKLVTSEKCNPQKPVTSGKISPQKLVTSEKCNPQKPVTSGNISPQKLVISEKCSLQKPVTSEKCSPQKSVTSEKCSPLKHKTFKTFTPKKAVTKKFSGGILQLEGNKTIHPSSSDKCLEIIEISNDNEEDNDIILVDIKKPLAKANLPSNYQNGLLYNGNRDLKTGVADLFKKSEAHVMTKEIKRNILDLLENSDEELKQKKLLTCMNLNRSKPVCCFCSSTSYMKNCAVCDQPLCSLLCEMQHHCEITISDDEA